MTVYGKCYCCQTLPGTAHQLHLAGHHFPYGFLGESRNSQWKKVGGPEEESPHYFLTFCVKRGWSYAATRAVSCRGSQPVSGRSGGWPRGRCDGVPQPASLPPPLPHIVRFAANPDAVGERDECRYGTTADLPLVGVDSHSIEAKTTSQRTGFGRSRAGGRGGYRRLHWRLHTRGCTNW